VAKVLAKHLLLLKLGISEGTYVRVVNTKYLIQYISLVQIAAPTFQNNCFLLPNSASINVFYNFSFTVISFFSICNLGPSAAEIETYNMKLIAEDKEEKDAADKARAENGEVVVDAVIAGKISYGYNTKLDLLL
jgi:hypothetical protein